MKRQRGIPLKERRGKKEPRIELRVGAQLSTRKREDWVRQDGAKKAKANTNLSKAEVADFVKR